MIIDIRAAMNSKLLIRFWFCIARDPNAGQLRKSSGKFSEPPPDWVAHASRVLVAVSRRNSLSCALRRVPCQALGKVREREGALASTRDACATQVITSRAAN